MKRRVAGLLLLLVTAAAAGGDLPWTQLGPFNGFLGPTYQETVVAVPHTSTVYAGGAAGGYRSDDGGANWVTLVSAGGYGIKQLVLDPLAPATVYAATYGGVFRMQTPDAIWEPAGLGDQGVWALAIDPSLPSTLYAGTYPHSGGDYGFIFKSTDSGASWQEVDAILLDRPISLAVDPRDASVVYAGTKSGSVLRSTDAGAGWTVVDQRPGPVYQVVADPVRPGVAYMGWQTTIAYDGSIGFGGLRRTSDGGATWSDVAGLPDRHAGGFLIDPDAPDVFYFRANGSLYRSRDAGQSWSALGPAPPVGQLAISSDDPRHLYAVGDFGVWGLDLSLLPPTCDATPTTLCLQFGRFSAHVDWKQSPFGPSFQAQAVPVTTDSGYFWFFGPENVELMVKVLDGTLINDHYWVFYGALSDVAYTLTVTDTLTGATQVYENPQGTLASVADTQAFPIAVSAHDANARPPSRLVFPSPAIVCEPDPASLCLEDGRFQVSAAWQKTPSGPSYSATAVPLTRDTGYFWFFDEANVELVVKVLDGTAVNGHHWVFYGALSDVEYTITVTDTLTGATQTYENPQGTLASVADTGAF
jgi:hypothetical protein